MYRRTSVEAYHNLKDLGARQKRVYECLASSGPRCNLELSHVLGLPINQVTPRTNELVKMGLVKEFAREIVAETGRRAIFWQIVSPEPVQESMFA